MKNFTFVIHFFLLFNFITNADYIFEDFTTNPEPWGSAKWNIEISQDGLSASNPYLLVDSIGSPPKEALFLEQMILCGLVIIFQKVLLVSLLMYEI